MHKERKLKEARFFLGEMHAHERDPSAFIHLLSGSYRRLGRSPNTHTRRRRPRPVVKCSTTPRSMFAR